MGAILFSSRSVLRKRTPTPFPSSIAGLAARYEPELGITQVSQNVTAWADQSTNANNLAQSGSASLRPDWGTAFPPLNSRPLINFTTAGQYLAATKNTGILTNSFTIFTLFRLTSLTPTTQALASFGPSSGGREFRVSSGKLDLAASNGASTPFDYASGTTALAANTAYVGTVASTTTTAQFYLNGTADGPSVTTTGQGFATTSTGVSIGVGPNLTSDPFKGSIGTVLAYGRVLTAGERALVHSYIADKYALKVSDHV